MNIAKEISGKRVFISYASEDRAEVDQLKHHLVNIGANVGTNIWSDNAIGLGESWADAIKYELNASDVVILCLSKNSVSGHWQQHEFQSYLSFAKDRHIKIIPLLLDKSPAPENLKKFQFVDAIGKTDFDTLLEKVANIERINFDDFSAAKFEELILELLRRLKFEKLTWRNKISDRGFDFMGEYYDIDPFGLPDKQIWLFECKLYRKSRFDLKSVHEIIGTYKSLHPNGSRLALITNSQFTSVVKEYIEEVKSNNLIDIRLIDGFQLKELISEHKDLVEAFFKK